MGRTMMKDALFQLSKIYFTDIGERTAIAEMSMKARNQSELWF